MKINFGSPVTTWFAGPVGYTGWTQGSILSLIVCSEQLRGVTLSFPTEDRSLAARCSHQRRSIGKIKPERVSQSSPAPTCENIPSWIPWSLFLFLWSGNFTLRKWEGEQLPGITLIFSVPPEAAGWITPTHFGPCYGIIPKISHSDWKQRWAPWRTYHNSVLWPIQSFQPQHLQRATRS